MRSTPCLSIAFLLAQLHSSVAATSVVRANAGVTLTIDNAVLNAALNVNPNNTDTGNVIFTTTSANSSYQQIGLDYGEIRFKNDLYASVSHRGGTISLVTKASGFNAYQGVIKGNYSNFPSSKLSLNITADTATSESIKAEGSHVDLKDNSILQINLANGTYTTTTSSSTFKDYVILEAPNIAGTLTRPNTIRIQDDPGLTWTIIRSADGKKLIFRVKPATGSSFVYDNTALPYSNVDISAQDVILPVTHISSSTTVNTSTTENIVATAPVTTTSSVVQNSSFTTVNINATSAVGTISADQMNITNPITVSVDSSYVKELNVTGATSNIPKVSLTSTTLGPTDDTASKTTSKFTSSIVTFNGLNARNAILSIDPSFVRVQNSPNSVHEISIGTVGDPYYSTLMFDWGNSAGDAASQSTLTIGAGGMTIRAKSVLVIGVHQNAGANSTRTVISAAGNNISGTFEYIFKCDLNNDGSVKANSISSLNDPITGTTDYLAVTQGVGTIDITKSGAASVGYTSTSLFQTIADNNPAFAEYFGTQSQLLTTTLQFDATTLINSTIEVCKGGATRMITASVVDATDGFVSSPDLQTSKRDPRTPLERLEHFVNVLQSNGPIEKQNDEMRIWVAPYYNVSRTRKAPHNSGSKQWVSGGMVGTEYRNTPGAYSVGFLTGAHFGKQEDLSESRTHMSYKGFTGGLYHSKGFLENARYDVMGSRSVSFLNRQRYAKSAFNNEYFTANATQRAVVDIADASTSYKFRFQDGWSFRPNLGHTSSRVKVSRFAETNVGHNSLSQSPSTQIVHEVYAGVGLRSSFTNGKERIRITGVYEYGYEWKKKANTINITQSSPAVAPINFKSAQRLQNHYVTVNTSILDRNQKFKVAFSYAGVYNRRSRNHTGVVKLEWVL